MDGDQVTHVLVPIDEYERVFTASMVERAAAVRADAATEWVPHGELAVHLAAGRIADARRVAGLTQKDLAELVGITQSEVSRIENHPDRTTVRTLRRLAAALNVDVRSLL